MGLLSMTIEEAIDAVKVEGKYTENNLENLKKAIEEADIKSFDDKRFKIFVEFIDDMPYHTKIQEIMNTLLFRGLLWR